MPVPKRWFPLSRDINDDAEVWELTDKFRGNALRLWMEILAILNRTENHWRLSGPWLAGLARKCRMTSTTVQRCIDWMVEKHWLNVPEYFPDGSPAIYSAPNYWKFHRSRGAKRDSDETQNGDNMAPPLDLTSLDLTKRDFTTKKERERNESSLARISSLKEFELNEELREFATKEGIQDTDAEFLKFKDYYRANGKPLKNLSAAFSSWCRKSRTFSNNSTREASDTARCEYKAKNPNEIELWGSEQCKKPRVSNSKKFCAEHKDYRQQLQEAHSR